MSANEVFKPVPLSLLARIFELIDFQVSAQDLSVQYEETGYSRSTLHPTQAMGRLLSGIGRRDLQAAWLRWSKFDRSGLPSLLAANNQWFVAVADPRSGYALIDESGQAVEADAVDMSVAQVLWLKKAASAAESKPVAQSPVARLVAQELFKSRTWIAEVVAATVIVNLLAVATSMYAMQVYDRVVPTMAFSTLWTLSIGMVLIAIIDWLLKYLRARILDTMSKQVDIDVSKQLFDHLLKLRIDTRGMSVSNLLGHVGGLESVRGFFSSFIIFSIIDIPFALVFILFIGAIGGQMGWVYLATLPLGLSLGWMAQYRLRKLQKAEIRQMLDRQSVVIEAIQGAETLQTSGAGWRLRDEWIQRTNAMAQHSLKNKQITSATMNTALTLGSLAYVLAIVVGVHLIEAGTLTMGAMIASTILGGRIIAPMSQGVQMLAQWQQVRESIEMLDRFWGLEEIRKKDEHMLIIDNNISKIDLQKVKYSYPGQPVIRVSIDNISFKAGDRVLLLGGVGSGKSTLLKLIAGLYMPTDGRILIGGADTTHIDPQVLVNHMSYLPQSVQLFRGSLRTNLALNGEASDAEILRVAELIGIDKIAADSPKGLEMDITEGGGGLSDGQKQLVGIGRAMLSSSSVWLLDEPTASLDSESEQRVVAALNQKISPLDIAIVSTHKTTLLPLANRVIVMKKGEVVFDGSPEALRAMSKPAAAAT